MSYTPASAGLSAADWAAIWQAGAATVALGVAVWVPAWQRRTERKQQRADEQARAKWESQKAYALANLVAKLLDESIKAAIDAANWSRFHEVKKHEYIVRDLLEAGKGIDFQMLTPLSVEALVRIRAAGVSAENIMGGGSSQVAYDLDAVHRDLLAHWNALNDAMPKEIAPGQIQITS